MFTMNGWCGVLIYLGSVIIMTLVICSHFIADSIRHRKYNKRSIRNTWHCFAWQFYRKVYDTLYYSEYDGEY